jgi:hypothetical protein
MSKSILELIKEHLVIWPQSVDSQLWNDRVETLLEQIKEFESKKDEPK